MASIAVSLLLNILYLSFRCRLPFMFLSLYVSLNFPKKDLVGLAQERGFLLERALLVVYRDFSLALTHCVTYCDWGHRIPGIVACI